MSIPIVTLLAYAFSGALGLVYEVAWARRLSLAFGGSQLATASALVAFMGGLALGARFLGRRAAWLDRPLRTYARLEIAIGIFGLASPWIIDAVQWIYLHTWPADEPGDLGFSDQGRRRAARCGDPVAGPGIDG